MEESIFSIFFSDNKMVNYIPGAREIGESFGV